MKKYTTYKRKKINDNFYADPNTNNGVEVQTGGKIIFHETPYELNGVFLSWIEFDGRSINPMELEYFRTLDPDFDFTIIDEATANIFLQGLWFDENGLQYVSVNNFEFLDNIPVMR